MTHDSHYQKILRLKALRSYRDEPIGADALTSILEAARWTGSAKNQQNWSFVVMQDPSQKERLAGAGSFSDPMRNAPVAIALVQEPDGYEFDTGRVAQNIMLAADALGIASCPITLHDDAVAAEVLGLPEGARCRYAIALGYPAAAVAAVKWGGRKPLEELVRWDHYGS